MSEISATDGGGFAGGEEKKRGHSLYKPRGAILTSSPHFWAERLASQSKSSTSVKSFWIKEGPLIDGDSRESDQVRARQ